MRNLVIGLFVLCLGLDLALGMVLFRNARQFGMAKAKKHGKGHHGGMSGKPSLEELTAEIKKHMEEFNTECVGVTTGSCDKMNPDIDTILNEAYTGTPNQEKVEEAFWNIIENVEGESFEEIHCTIRNCFMAKVYKAYQEGKRVSGCSGEEEAVGVQENTEEMVEDDEKAGMCAMQEIMDTCNLSENNGVYTVDVDQCASAVAQKIYDKIKKRYLVEKLKRVLMRKDNDDSSDDKRSADSDSDDKRSLDSDSDDKRSADSDSDDKRSLDSDSDDKRSDSSDDDDKIVKALKRILQRKDDSDDSDDKKRSDSDDSDDDKKRKRSDSDDSDDRKRSESDDSDDKKRSDSDDDDDKRRKMARRLMKKILW